MGRMGFLLALAACIVCILIELRVRDHHEAFAETEFVR